MVGSLLYLTSWARPDIAFAISELTRFVSNPGKPHLETQSEFFVISRNPTECYAVIVEGDER